VQPASFVEFAPFRLDLVNQELWRGADRLPIRGKPFAVLAYLATHPARLVPHEELVRAVWPDTHVGEGLLRGYVRELRTLLGDDAAAPRFIETVARRGYRFVAETRAGVGGTSACAPPVEGPPPDLLGRDAEMEALARRLAAAKAGTRQLVLVTGEAGIGKTTLVDAFLAAHARGLRIARGQCVEHFGPGEAYLPLLEAVGRLGCLPECRDVVAILTRHAPTWLVELPALVGDADLEAARRRVHGTTRDRMLREFAEAIEVLTAAHPLLLVLEDLQWSDHATCDVLSALARRRGPARLLVIGTYRPADLAAAGHPLAAIVRDLRARGQCEELALPPLGAEDVAAYLAARLPEKPLADLGRAVHEATEGNPLFVVNLVDYWMSRGLLSEPTPGGARPAALEAGVPDTLRQLIERQLDRLDPDARRALDAASVVGSEFSSAAVAAALEEAVEPVDERCEALAERGLFLRARGLDAPAPGAVAGRYEFLHALYRQVLYRRLSATRRARLHQRVGLWLERAYGELAHEHAAELALHFEEGCDPPRAVQHLYAAARNAMRRHAYHEATASVERALALLGKVGDGPERRERELALRMALGTCLLTTRGYAAPDVQRAYARAHELSRHMDGGPELAFALAGLFRFFFVRAEFKLASELAEQVVRIADAFAAAGERSLLPVAHSICGLPLLATADLAGARACFERALAVYDFEEHRGLALLHGDDPALTALAFHAVGLWIAGYPARALARIREAQALAERLAVPYSLAFAQVFAAWIHVRRGEAARAEACADAVAPLAAEHGFHFLLAEAGVFRGWALAAQGRVEAGIAQIREALAAHRAGGVVMGRPSHLALLAEACLFAREPEEGLAALQEALEAAAGTGERSYEAELHRLKGELLYQLAERGGRRSALEVEARACLEQALGVARRQGARSLELRAALGLARHAGATRGEAPAARRLLRDVVASFDEGFDTADLVAARALLDAAPSQSE